MSKKSLYINIKLSEVPGVARGILKTFLRILKGKKWIFFNLCYPQSTHGFKQKKIWSSRWPSFDELYYIDVEWEWTSLNRI